tara:strand:+ start:4479 stop:4778 length:300 start_codon:yes stop_codon:yes gene_type:complete
MIEKSKKCSYCYTVKSLQLFHKDRTMNDKHANRCISCTKLYYKTYYQKKNDRKAYFMYESLEDSKYIKDKNTLFREHGNGWWINNNSFHRKPLARKKTR